MGKFNVTPPTAIVLFSTLRCNAECESCSSGCNPRQGRSMTLDEMKGYVDKCLVAWPDSIKELGITGGECMTISDAVEGIVEYGTSKGLSVSLLSNAFWATSETKAQRVLKRLANKGLKIVAFSTGDNHMKFVPFKNVRNATVAAAKVGIATELRVEKHFGSSPLTTVIGKDVELISLASTGKIKITFSEWISFVKKGRTYKAELIQGVENKNCDNLFNTVPINPYGEVYACCGIPYSRLPYLRLGNINHEPIKDIYERAFSDVLKVWLKMDGPHHILEFVQKETGWKFDWHTYHPCDMCRLIMTDPRILPFLRDHYYKYISHVSIYNDVYGKE